MLSLASHEAQNHENFQHYQFYCFESLIKSFEFLLSDKRTIAIPSLCTMARTRQLTFHKRSCHESVVFLLQLVQLVGYDFSNRNIWKC